MDAAVIINLEHNLTTVVTKVTVEMPEKIFQNYSLQMNQLQFQKLRIDL